MPEPWLCEWHRILTPGRLLRLRVPIFGSSCHLIHPTLAHWPGDQPRDTVWRTLHRGVARGLLTIRGAGTKKDAFRYALKNLPANPAAANPPHPTP